METLTIVLGALVEKINVEILYWKI